MVKLNGRQANVMDHALAYPKMTRNSFRAEIGSINYEAWQDLCYMGFADLMNHPQHGNNIARFEVTGTGIEALKEYHNETDN